MEKTLNYRHFVAGSDDYIIINAVCAQYKVTPEELRNNRRFKKQVIPRHVVHYLLRLAGRTTSSIGRHTGRDHSTVLHSCNTVSDLLSYDMQLRKELNKISIKISKMKHNVQLIGKYKGLKRNEAIANFKEAQTIIENKGHSVWNPTERVNQHVTEQEAMRQCLSSLVSGAIHEVAVLPNHETSEGSAVEIAVAKSIGLKITYL